jgi:pyruvate/2-oxoglutarate dehydrogenase complex dihydrolipoamide acyltransferase (E2) component
MKTSVRNVAPGIRGLNTVQGYRELAPGDFVESVELTDDEHKNADSTGYFAFGKAAKTAETAAPAGAAAPTPTPTPAEELPNNVPKLKKIARDEGIDVGDATSSADLKAAITAGRATAAAGGITPPAPGPGDDLDNMADDDLRNTVAALTGKPASDYADTDRDELLKLARGEG